MFDRWIEEDSLLNFCPFGFPTEKAFDKWLEEQEQKKAEYAALHHNDEMDSHDYAFNNI
jgi:hypothetical protein